MLECNAYDGEMTLVLYHKPYPMRINLAVLAQFEEETGTCFNTIAVRALYAWEQSQKAESSLARAEYLTEAISMKHAAILFYLAAKQKDSHVTFPEIQEAVLMEGAISRLTDTKEGEPIKSSRSYPVLFVELVMFALMGVFDKKKEPS